MMADIVGFSRMLEADERRNARHAARSMELFKSLIGTYGGQVVTIAGDGVLALFDSAEAALSFGTLIQSEFREQAVWEDGEPIEMRIGVHLGEVARDSPVIQAHCVNIAARIQTLAQPGSMVITAGVRQAVRGLQDLAFTSIGTPALKNIAEPIEVFAVTPLTIDRPKAAPRVVAEITPEAPPPDARAARNPVIAVLAFANLTGEVAHDYFSEGFVDGIIGDLSRFRSLTVIAQQSASLFSLKSRSAREIGHRLGADYLLSGSLQRAGKKVRVSVELIDAGTETVMWFDRFHDEIERLFEIQDEITGAVASRFSIQIDLAEHRREVLHPPDLRSYGLVLRGQQMVLSRTKATNAYGRGLFEEAIRSAPAYARAYSAASRTHNLDWRYFWSADPRASLDTAVSLAQRGIRLDRLDAHAFAALGFAHLYSKHIDEALADYGHALALNPNDADVITQYGDALTYAGHPDRAIPNYERAMRLNPFYPDWYLWCLAEAYDALGRAEDVVMTLQRMQHPEQAGQLLAANLAHLGQNAEAQALASGILRGHPEYRVSVWADRMPYRDRAVLDRLVAGLRAAGLPE